MSTGAQEPVSILCCRCCFILALFVAGPCSAAERLQAGLTLPHLEFGTPASYLLPSGQPWKPGETTMVTALMSGQPLQVQVSLVQEMAVLHSPSLHLLYKCNASSHDGDFSRIRLTSNGSSSLQPGVTYCKPTRPFTVALQPGDVHSYSVSLSEANDIPFVQALRHSLEFRLQADYAEGVLESRSLFVYNFDALAKLNSATKSHLGVPFTRYILTEKAVQFMSSLVGAQNLSVESVQFLDPQFLQVFHDASLHIRNTITVTVMIRGNSQCADKLVPGFTDLVISTGDPQEAIMSTFAAYSDISLHLPSGMLYFSRESISRHRSALTAKYATKLMQICIRVSANAPVWNYHLTLPVTQTLRGPFAASGSLSLDGSCTVAADGNYEWRILTEGSQDVILVNPIICPRAGTDVANVYFREKECTNHILSSPGKQWQNCDGFAIARTGGAVLIAGPVNQSHSGNYMFMRGGAMFVYLVTVVSFPLFRDTLPHRTFANLDTQVRLNCTAYHDDMSHVMLEPRFRVLERFRQPKWRTLSLDEFALEVLHLAPRSISLVASKTENSNSLLVTMPHVNSHWQTWILVYSCRATVIDEDVRKLGLPSYEADTSTDVVYFGNRISSFDAAAGVHAWPVLVSAAAAAAAALLLWLL